MWLKAIADFQIRVFVLHLDQTTFPTDRQNGGFRVHTLGVVTESFVTCLSGFHTHQLDIVGCDFFA